MMFWKKKKQNKRKYYYNKNTSFENALMALKDGHIIKSANYNDTYLIMIKGRIFELMDREINNCFEIKEFDIYEMSLDSWQIIEPLTQARRLK